MSEKIISRLELALKKIEHINKVCDKVGVVKALEDETLLKPALMMHIDIIYQQIAKLEQANEYEILSKFDKEACKA
ncbi:MAG: hypothetical protein GX282_03815 [Campylobacteraceae bacterium]|nr:hypothetical protein [Campylobacteraceae bacterium]